MPRSYSFDHFTAGKQSPIRSPIRFDSRQYSDSRGKNGETVHYGKQHAETESIYQAKEMATQLEELAGIREETVPERSPVTPIGALPETPEAPLHFNGLRALWDQSLQNVKTLRTSLDEARRAAMALAMTPLEFAKTLARELNRELKQV